MLFRSRNTADIETNAADVFLFDDRHLLAELGQPDRAGIAPGASTDHDCIELFLFTHGEEFLRIKAGHTLAGGSERRPHHLHQQDLGIRKHADHAVHETRRNGSVYHAMIKRKRKVYHVADLDLLLVVARAQPAAAAAVAGPAEVRALRS